MANTFLTISMITHECLRILENNLVFASKVNRNYDDKFAVEGAKIGTVLNVRKPPKYVGRTGATMSVEDSTDTQVPVSINKQFGVDINFTSADLALTMDDFAGRYLKPAIGRIANEIDKDGLALYKDVYQTIGTPGTVPTALKTYLKAGVKLNNSAAPVDDDRCIVVTSGMEIELVDALKGLFHSSAQIAEQYRKGQMGLAGGFQFYMDQNVNTHTVGALGGTPLVNGADQSGSSIATDGWTTDVTGLLKKGDVITLAGVQSVNPQSRMATGQLQDFVVTADVDSDDAGEAEIPISPSITTSGAYQTVNSGPADNAVIEIIGAANTLSPQGIAFHKDAFTLVSADLPLPGGVDMAGRVADPDVGVSIRLVRGYDISKDKFPCRLDVLYGWKTLRPELACRIAA